MLFNEIRNLIASGDVDENTLTTTAAYLLRKQFVFRNQPGDQSHFQIVDKYYQYFEKAFSFFGAELTRNYDSAYIGYIPKKQLSSLKLVETACLLTLRLIYDQEKLSGMGNTMDGTVSVSGDRVIQEYRINTGRDDLGKSVSFKEAMKPLRQKSIIRLGDKNIESDVEDIIILPSIEAVIDKHYALTLTNALENNHLDQNGSQDIQGEELIHEAN